MNSNNGWNPYPETKRQAQYNLNREREELKRMAAQLPAGHTDATEAGAAVATLEPQALRVVTAEAIARAFGLDVD